MEFKYNPGFSSDAALIKSFVVRQPYLEMILEILRQNNGSVNQHVLVVGARGTGKTMLVRRVAAEIRKDSSLDRQWYPLVFAEESYQITTVGEFWLEALFHLTEQTQDINWMKVYEELKKEADEIRLRQRALAQLMDFADAQGKRILLVVENLNMLFAEQMGAHDDWELRHTLQNESRLMLLGTATQRFEQIEDIEKAWFEFFTVYALEPLSLEDCRALWTGSTGKAVEDNRLKPIRILTGGNPRLMRILIDFAVDLSLKNLMANLSQLIDEHTDYFKSHLEILAVAERKVFIALLELWDPSGAREIAEAARMEVNKVSALLNRLVNRGAVMVVPTEGRKKFYQAAERLYNIYYLMRRRSHPSSRVQAAVTFMVSFYQDEELVRVILKLASEACNLTPQERADYFYAYHGVWQAMKQFEVREKLLAATPKDFFNAPDTPDSVKQLLSISIKKQYQESWQEIHRGYELSNAGNDEEAITIFDDAIARFQNRTELPLLEQLASALYNKGVTLGRLGRSHEEVGVYDEVISRFEHYTELSLLELIAKAFINKGITLDRLGRSHEEVGVYDELISRFEHYTELSLLEPLAKAFISKGNTLARLGRSEEAVAAYDEVIARLEHRIELPLMEQLTGALINKGFTLGNLGHSKEAIDLYNKVISRLEQCTEPPMLERLAWALYNKGNTLDRLGRSEEAVASYNEVIGYLEHHVEPPLRELLAMTLNNKAVTLGSLGRSEEAEQSTRKSLEVMPTLWQANGFLCELLIPRHQWTELWEKLPTLLTALTTEEEAKVRIINLFLQIAAAGQAAKLVQLISDSEAATQLEPMIVGLRIYLGEQPLVAQEILEVGQDVAQRIWDMEQVLPMP
jgi:tetratricopeptide (TPR) repeat protein